MKNEHNYVLCYQSRDVDSQFFASVFMVSHIRAKR